MKALYTGVANSCKAGIFAWEDWLCGGGEGGGGRESSSLNGHIKFSRPHSNFNGSRRWSSKVHKMDYVIYFVLAVFRLEY